MLAVILFRIGDYFHQGGRHFLSTLVQLLIYFTRNEIHPGASIGPGLILPDIGGVGIPAFANIGANCTFTGRALLSIGGIEGINLEWDRLYLGDNCIIGAGARILGAVTLADGIEIKPNSVVLTSFKDSGTVVSGIPGRRRAKIPPDSVASWNPLKGLAMIQTACDHNGTDTVSSGSRGTLHPQRQSLRHTIRLVREDLDFRCSYEHKTPTPSTRLKLLLTPGALCVVLYRWQTFFETNHLAPMACLLRAFNLFAFTVSIHSSATIAGGLTIIHANSVIIGDRVEIGPRCLMFHQNWVGFSPFFQDLGPGALAKGPVIGADVIFGAGACAFGDITIGDGCKIGVNAAVDSSFPAKVVLFGVPARRVGNT